MMASGAAATTASRSASMSPLCRLLTRTIRRGRSPSGTACLRKATERARASGLPSGATESSRSRMTASAPLVNALSSLRLLSAGANRNERIGLFWPHPHEGLASALGDQLAILIVSAMVKLDDAGAGARFRFALGDHFGRGMHGVAFKQWMRKLDLGHAEICDRGADREVGHRHPDHQPER